MENTLFDKTTKNGIKSFVISNFRGIGYRHEILNGENLDIVGKNETYKTTVLEALVWCLNSKLLDNTSRIENIVPREMPKDTLVSVEIEFMSSTKVKREYQQKYATNRESGERYLTNPIQTLYIDDVKQTSLEKGQGIIYNELGMQDAIKQVPNKVDLFMLLFIPQYIKTVDNKVLRELFESVVGEPNVSEIIKTLPEDVQLELSKNGFKFDSIKAKHEQNIKSFSQSIELKKSEVDKLNVAKTQSLSEVVVDVKDLEQQKIKLNDELVSIRVEKTKGVAELTKDIDIKLREKQTLLQTTYIDYQKNIGAKNVEINERLKKHEDLISGELANKRGVEKELNDKIHFLDVIEESFVTNQEKQQSLLEQREDLRTQFHEVNTPTFVTAPISKERFDIYTTEEMKPIREEKLKTIKEKGLKVNNAIKEYDILLHELNEDIVKTRKEIDDIQESIMKIDTSIKKLENNRDDDSAITSLRNDIDTLHAFYQKDELHIKSEIKTLENERNTLLTTNQTLDNGVDEKIKSLEMQIGELDSKILQSKTKRNYDEDIKGYVNQIKDYENQLVFSQKVVALIKKVEREKLVLLDKLVETKFGNEIKVELFKFTEQETITPTFNIYVLDKDNGWVSIFQGINDGQFAWQILKITNKIRSFLGVRDSFYLVDGLESVDSHNRQKLFNLGQQVISTTVVEQ